VSSTATADQKRSQRRRGAVDAYVAKLRERLVEQDRPGEPAVIELSGRTVTIEPWIVARILDGGDDAGRSDTPDGLLAQTVALEMKIACDRNDLELGQRSGGQKLYAAQAELMLDAAIGAALSRELQGVVDDEVRSGRLDDAKSWTRLRNALHKRVAQTKELLADSERQRVESLSDSLTDKPRLETSTPEGYGELMRRIDEQETKRKRQQRLKRLGRAKLANLPSRTEILVGLLAIVAACWLAFIQLPRQLAAPLPVLALDDLPRADGFLEVDARPPSLYLTLDGAMWATLDREARRQLVHTLSSVLLTSDYSGALLRTEDGRPVAQWLALHGVRLLEQGEVRPPTVNAGEAAPQPPAADGR
jgi:hypothetical protein